MATASEPPAKRRRPNFTEDELVVMIEEVRQRRVLLLGSFDGDKVTAKKKAHAWEQVTRAINAVSRVQRDATEVRKKFTDYRSYVKKKAAKRIKEQKKTG